jgi:hypothetical protein
MKDAKHIGLDVHQATISVAFLDSVDKLVMEAILETKAETILQFLRGLRGSLRVTCGPWEARASFSPPTTDSRFGRCMRFGSLFWCFSIRYAFGLRGSNSAGMIGG